MDRADTLDMLVLYVCGTILLGCLFYGYGETRYAAGVAAGTALQTQTQVDQQCAKWLFNTDLQAAKKRICGGKK